MRLHFSLIVSLMYISTGRGYVNKRLQSLYATLQQRRFVAGAGGARAAGDPYSYLRPAPAPAPARAHERRSPGNTELPGNSHHEANLTGIEPLDWPRRGARRDDDGAGDWDRAPPASPTLDNTYFCAIKNVEPLNAEVVTDEKQFPWLARVYHVSVESDRLAPLVCTAALVAEMIFITAARCIATAKASFTTVHYKEYRLAVKAFIWPANSSKQMFDDLGAILTWTPVGPAPAWQPVLLSNATRRTDDHFSWFESWGLHKPDNTVVGFHQPEGSLSKPVLYKLGDMLASSALCNRILPRRAGSSDYWIPCAHTCTPTQHLVSNSSQCERRLVGLGHVLLDRDERMVGVVTWHCESEHLYAMPLGIAVVNRDDYWSHVECVRRIVNDTVPRKSSLEDITVKSVAKLFRKLFKKGFATGKSKDMSCQNLS